MDELGDALECLQNLDRPEHGDRQGQQLHHQRRDRHCEDPFTDHSSGPYLLRDLRGIGFTNVDGFGVANRIGHPFVLSTGELTIKCPVSGGFRA